MGQPSHIRNYNNSSQETKWIYEVKAVNKIAVVVTFLTCLQVPVNSYANGGKTVRGDDAAKLAACPLEGDAKNTAVRQLNSLKRRITTPAPADIDSQVTLAAMAAPGFDTSRFDTKRGATIVGYVADVKVGGVESVNCHTHDPKYRDTHIELTLDPLHDAESKHIIVEVTPQWRETMAAEGVDWTTPTLRAQLLGRWVKVTGWLFFDEEHANAAENTASVTNHIWRATVWEIHPITSIEVLPGRH